MNRIGLVGLNWKYDGPEGLSQFTLPIDERPGRLPALAQEIGATELVYLATCNRVELAFVTDAHSTMDEYRARIYKALRQEEPESGQAETIFNAWAGEGAVEHLFLVASGLDSAKVGETDIIRQVREAFEMAKTAQTVGPRLNHLFEEALKVAAKVQKKTGLGRGHTSLAEIAIAEIEKHLQRHAGPITLLGVGPMTERTAQAFAGRHPIYIVNRTLSRAQALAEKCRGTALSLDSWTHNPPPTAALLAATGAPTQVVTHPLLEKLSRRGNPQPILIDMAVPNDIDGDAAADLAIKYLEMEDIIAIADQTRDKRLVEAADARLLVDKCLEDFRRRLCERLMSPLIVELRRRSQVSANHSLERLLRRDLNQLDAGQQESVQRFTRSLVNKLIHLPSAGLRALAFEAGPEAVEAFLSGADRELTDILKGIAEQAEALTAPQEELF